MNVLLISLLVATLAMASFANVVPSNEHNFLDQLPTPEATNVTSTQNATTTTLDMSEALAELIVAYTNIMPCGNASIGLPPMVPFRMPSVKVNFSGEHLALNGDIENLVIAGLDDYIIIELATNASINRTEIDMLYKDIQILGKFNLKVEADLSGFKYVQPLKGFINLQILNYRNTIGVTIGQNEVGGIELSNLDNSVQVGDIIVNNLNTEWSVAVNNFANQYVRDFSMLFLQTNREVFGKMYSEFATTMVNKALYNVPYGSLNSYLVESIKLLKSMECNK